MFGIILSKHGNGRKVGGGVTRNLTGANCSQSATSGTGVMNSPILLVGAPSVQIPTSDTGSVQHNITLTGAASAQVGSSATGVVGSGAPRILNLLSVSAAGAGSLRKLNANYTGSAVRVRRSSDNVEADIGFTAAGDLDETALTAHVGSNSGYIARLYDQTGNARDFVQATTANQPRLVNAGTIERIYNRPATRTTGAAGIGLATGSFSIAQPLTRASVIKFADATSSQVFIDSTTSTANYLSILSGTLSLNAGSSVAGHSGVVANEMAPIVSIQNGASSVFSYRGTPVTINPGTNGINGVEVGARYDGVTLNANAWFGDIIVFSSALSVTDRKKLETDQNSYYSPALYVSTTGHDTNPGTQAAPYRTIGYAASQATPGTVMHVASGTYAETFTSSVSGTAAAPITYVSDTKWGAKIIPASSTSDTLGWTVSGSYITVDGFELDGQSSLGWRTGLYATGSHITIKNCLVHHVGNATTCDNNGGAGIIGDGSATSAAFIDVLNCITHHCGPGAINSCEFWHGIYMACSDFTVKNCLAYRNNGTGINVNHDWARGYIINNTVFYNGSGILCSGSDFINFSASGPVTIENNLVYDNNPNGTPNNGNIRGIGVFGTVTGSSLIANNFANGDHDIEIYMVGGGGTTSGNITSGSPGFVNYLNTGSGDYHLTAGSQCVGAGLITYAPGEDLDFVIRPQGAAVDMGCYER